MLSFVSLFLVLLLVSSCFGLVVFFHPPLPPDPPSPSNQLGFASTETLIGPLPLQSAITFAYGLGIRQTLTLRTREIFLHPSVPGYAGLANSEFLISAQKILCRSSEDFARFLKFVAEIP